MPEDEEQIRTLIEQWAVAVHRGDMNGVLADHSEDIVMFDVPPPYEGVRGIDAYRETWLPFFEWQAQGAAFEIESLDITAGDDVAFAHVLLRCGTTKDLAERPENRLRLTLGLRKEHGRWVVAHEHHSFPHTAGGETAPAAAAEHEVHAVHQEWFDGTAAKDLDGVMSHIAEDVISYEHSEPLQYLGLESIREECRRGLEAASGAIDWDVPDLKILVREDIAVAWGLNRMQTQQPDGETAESWSRGTRVFQRGEGEWMMIHQHVSFPFDPKTGQAKTDLRP
ncbi:SgcJ/EcaC family oxidoreductase [Streptomyces canus]